MYSVRQLAARNSGADLVKSERPLPALVPTGGAVSTDASHVVLDDEENLAAKESVVDDESKNEDRPLAVTASIFRSANGKDNRSNKNGLRKNNALPKPIQEKAFVQALKESLEESIKESLKENDEPATEDRQEFRPSFATSFILQVHKLSVKIYKFHHISRK